MKIINFEYPTLEQLESIKAVMGQDDIKRNLKTILSPIDSKILYAIKQNKDGTHIAAYCRDCHAKLVWRKKGRAYEIEKANNFHSHSTKSLVKLKKASLISEFIDTLPQGLEKKAIVELVSARLNVPKASISSALKKPQKKIEKNLEEIVEKNASDWAFIMDSEFTNSSLSLPKQLILTNNRMKELYQKYGRTVSFDLAFSALDEQSRDAGDQNVIGFFSGLNSFNNVVIFSAFILRGRTRKDYKQLLQSFFKAQNSKFPETICTDHQLLAFIEAVKQLKSQGVMETDHTLNRWHLLRSVKQNQRHLQKIDQLLNSRTSFEYRLKYNNLISRMSFEEIDEFLQQIHERRQFYSQSRDKSCLAFIEKFVGLNVDSRNKNWHNRLKNALPSRKPYHLMTKVLISFSNKINEAANVYKIEGNSLKNYLLTPSLKNLRVQVSKQVYQFFMREWAQSQLYSSQKVGAGLHRVFNFEGEQYFVKLSENKWRCECNLIAKTGVSCSHEIKVLALQGVSLVSGIDSIWLFEQRVTKQIIEQINNKKQRRRKLRSKTTRTNRIP